MHYRFVQISYFPSRLLSRTESGNGEIASCGRLRCMNSCRCATYGGWRYSLQLLEKKATAACGETRKSAYV